MSDGRRCYYCRKPGGLRPYGPGCAFICFKCMKADPEREEEVGRIFLAQLDAAGPVAVIDGGEAGPYPIEHAIPPQQEG